MNRIEEQVLIGPAGMSPAGSMSPLELVESDCGIMLTSTGTHQYVESYFGAFIKNANGGLFKAGAMAFTAPDKSAQSGYGAWNCHATSYRNGVTYDVFGFIFWADHGAAVFPDGTESTYAPGDKVFKVNGDHKVTGKFGCNGSTPQAPLTADGTIATIEAALKACGIMV